MTGNPNYFDSIVEQWKDAIFAAARVDDPLHFERMLKMFAETVSRDTRHKAYRVSLDTSDAILHLQMDGKHDQT